MARRLWFRTAAALGALLAAAAPAAAQRSGFGRVPTSGVPRARHGVVPGRARAAVYTVVTLAGVKDAALANAAEARLASSLAGTSGRVLVDADDPTASIGTGPSHLTVAVFDDVGSGQAWQGSDAVKAILADLGRAGTVTVVTAGGIADPGPRPSVPAAALGPGKALKVFSVPTIADICKGC